MKLKKKSNNPIKNWGMELNRVLKKKYKWLKFFKKCSIPSVIQEMQTETILRFLSSPSWND